MDYHCTVVVENQYGNTRTIHKTLHRPEPGPDWGPSYVAQLAANELDEGRNRVVEFHYAVNYQPLTDSEVRSELADLDRALEGLS